MLLYLVRPESSRTFCCKEYKRIGVVFKMVFPRSVERIISLSQQCLLKYDEGRVKSLEAY